MWTYLRTKSFIILFISAVVCAWAGSSSLLPVKKHEAGKTDGKGSNDSTKIETAGH